MHRIDSQVRRAATLVAVLASLLLSACASSPEADEAAGKNATVFEGARLIVGDGRAPIENASMVVAGNRIVQVAAAGAVRVPAGATRVSLAGKTVMPAIIDTHTHLNITREPLVEDLRRRAYYGIGTVMSLGSDPGQAPLDMRSETIPGAAKYMTAGRGLTAPEPGRSLAPYWIKDEAEGRRAVQELSSHKVELIKIWVDTRDGKYPKLTPAQYGAIIDEAHKRGMRVTAHIFDMEDAKGLLRGGIDAFAHGVRDRDIDDEVVTLFKARPQVVLVPNLPDRGVATDMSWLKASLPAPELAKLQAAATDRPAVQKTFGIQARNLAKLNAAGVRIALGTDGNTPWAPHVEMEDMAAAGMTPAQVIVAATRNAAEFLKLKDVGTLQAGKSADFIVLDANPLEDIRNTRRISSVYLRGVAVNRDVSPMLAPPPATFK